MKKPVYLYLPFLILCAVLVGCGTAKKAFDPDRKYAPAELRRDYGVFRQLLEDWHPSLYWYTSRDSMNYYFDKGLSELGDSLTEPQFRTVLSYVIAKVDCGHTSVRSSRAFSKYLDSARLPQFPLIMKFWNDTMVLALNLNRHDTVLKRGVQILSINGRSARQLTDTLFPYFVTDGYNLTGKYQYLSTGFNFSSWYKNVFGYTSTFTVGYADSNGIARETVVPLWDPRGDTVRRGINRSLTAVPKGQGQEPGRRRSHRPGRRSRKRRELFLTRNLQLDSANQTAFMTLNTFERGNHLGGFFRQSFRTLEEKQVKNLVIDVRSNGGGDASKSTQLTRYLIDKKFKLADSLYTIRRHSSNDRYINNGFLYSVLTWFASSKRSDGKYHYGYFERHWYSPFRKHHFDGQVYILTGGNSFSATCLFAGALKGQHNVTLVGEETGGGYYGNTAWMIPDVTLPETGVRFRLPRFRLVANGRREKNGRGVMPDVPSLPSIEAIAKGLDFKTAKVKELIRLQAVQK
ncbi:MAG TPA: S41 family peptidase [Puia sp.]